MDLSKISRNDWIVVGGFVLMLIGVSLTWYSWSAGVKGLAFFSVSYSGWHYFLGWFPWLLTLVAALLVLVKVIPGFKLTLPVPEALSVMALGGVAFVLVLIQLIVAPSIATVTANSRGAGLFIGLIATAVVAVGGFLKNSEPAS
jgi:hypothetical protein